MYKVAWLFIVTILSDLVRTAYILIIASMFVPYFAKNVKKFVHCLKTVATAVNMFQKVISEKNVLITVLKLINIEYTLTANIIRNSLIYNLKVYFCRK